MKRKRLKHYADVLCRMFMGWRMYNDFEVLAELPDGILQFNFLKGTANHSAKGGIELNITQEITAWLKSEAAKDGIDIGQISEALLVVKIKTDLVKTNRKKVVCFSFDCASKLVTREKSYEAFVVETHKYHDRISLLQSAKKAWGFPVVRTVETSSE